MPLTDAAARNAKPDTKPLRGVFVQLLTSG